MQFTHKWFRILPFSGNSSAKTSSGSFCFHCNEATQGNFIGPATWTIIRELVMNRSKEMNRLRRLFFIQSISHLRWSAYPSGFGNRSWDSGPVTWSHRPKTGPARRRWKVSFRLLICRGYFYSIKEKIQDFCFNLPDSEFKLLWKLVNFWQFYSKSPLEPQCSS